MSEARDPLRWIDDPAIDPSLRDAVRAARDAAPSFDPVLGFARLESSMRASAAAASAGTLVTCGALALLVLTGLSSWADAPPLESSAESVPRAPEGAPHELLVASSDAPAPPGGTPAAITSDRAAAVVLEQPSEGHVAEAAAHAPRRARDDSAASDGALAREIAQLAAARRMLSSDPARALALLDDGRERYPSSVFGEERLALRVLGLAALHRDAEARAEGGRFLATHPVSPFAERIRRALEGSEASLP